MLRASSWIYIQELFLAMLGGPSGVLGVESGSAVCEVNSSTSNTLIPVFNDIFFTRKYCMIL